MGRVRAGGGILPGVRATSEARGRPTEARAGRGTAGVRGAPLASWRARAQGGGEARAHRSSCAEMKAPSTCLVRLAAEPSPCWPMPAAHASHCSVTVTCIPPPCTSVSELLSTS